LSTNTLRQAFIHVRVFNRTEQNPIGGIAMLGWAIFFLIVAIVAAVLGFGGIAGTAALIAKILFGVFVVLFVIFLVRLIIARTA